MFSKSLFLRYQNLFFIALPKTKWEGVVLKTLRLAFVVVFAVLLIGLIIFLKGEFARQFWVSSIATVTSVSTECEYFKSSYGSPQNGKTAENRHSVLAACDTNFRTKLVDRNYDVGPFLVHVVSIQYSQIGLMHQKKYVWSAGCEPGLTIGEKTILYFSPFSDYFETLQSLDGIRNRFLQMARPFLGFFGLISVLLVFFSNRFLTGQRKQL